MSLINSGFDGTVTERDFSRILRGAGVRDSVETVAAWAVTQGTGRQVSVAPGVAYAAGVVSDSGLAILAALPTPVNGQFHLVVRRINWASNTVTVATIPHTTTTTAIPTAPPAGFPVFNDNTGVLVDQHLAWAWVRSTDTTVAVFDLRSLPPARGVDLPVANFAALPTIGNFIGRQMALLDTGITHRWNGAAWIPSIEVSTSAATATAGYGINTQVFRRSGNVVTGFFDVIKSTAFANNGTDFFGTINNLAFRPANTVYGTGIASGSALAVTLQVQQNGNLSIFNALGASSATVMQLTVSYFVN